MPRIIRATWAPPNETPTVTSTITAPLKHVDMSEFDFPMETSVTHEVLPPKSLRTVLQERARSLDATKRAKYASNTQTTSKNVLVEVGSPAASSGAVRSALTPDHITCLSPPSTNILQSPEPLTSPDSTGEGITSPIFANNIKMEMDVETPSSTAVHVAIPSPFRPGAASAKGRARMLAAQLAEETIETTVESMNDVVPMEVDSVTPTTPKVKVEDAPSIRLSPASSPRARPPIRAPSREEAANVRKSVYQPHVALPLPPHPIRSSTPPPVVFAKQNRKQSHPRMSVGRELTCTVRNKMAATPVGIRKLCRQFRSIREFTQPPLVIHPTAAPTPPRAVRQLSEFHAQTSPVKIESPVVVSPPQRKIVTVQRQHQHQQRHSTPASFGPSKVVSSTTFKSLTPSSLSMLSAPSSSSSSSLSGLFGRSRPNSTSPAPSFASSIARLKTPFSAMEMLQTPISAPLRKPTQPTSSLPRSPAKRFDSFLSSQSRGVPIASTTSISSLSGSPSPPRDIKSKVARASAMRPSPSAKLKEFDWFYAHDNALLELQSKTKRKRVSAAAPASDSNSTTERPTKKSKHFHDVPVSSLDALPLMSTSTIQTHTELTSYVRRHQVALDRIEDTGRLRTYARSLLDEIQATVARTQIQHSHRPPSRTGSGSQEF